MFSNDGFLALLLIAIAVCFLVIHIKNIKDEDNELKEKANENSSHID
jgi:uncharacterized protein YoxC